MLQAPLIANTGIQYEIILQEKAKVQTHNEELRKEINNLKSQINKLKFELTQKDEDMEEIKQKIVDYG